MKMGEEYARLAGLGHKAQALRGPKAEALGGSDEPVLKGVLKVALVLKPKERSTADEIVQMRDPGRTEIIGSI
jgi:hypothetical protein